MTTMKSRRIPAPESYLPVADVTEAFEARAALRGPAEVIDLVRAHLHFDGDSADRPLDERYPPLRSASPGLRRLVVAELRRAGVKNVPDAEHKLWALASGYGLSDLADKLKVRRGVDPAAERLAWQERQQAKRNAEALATPVTGEANLPFALTDSQRAYIARFQAQRDVQSVSIVSHDPAEQAVRVKVTWKRPAYRYSVDNVRRYWVWPSPAAKRKWQETKTKTKTKTKAED